MARVISDTAASLLQSPPQVAQGFVLNGLTAARGCVRASRLLRPQSKFVSVQRHEERWAAACHTAIYMSTPRATAVQLKSIKSRAERHAIVAFTWFEFLHHGCEKALGQ